ncbi:MAG TPA: helicase-related protein [Vicinamibacterales bacterium]|nr:helicase-related protein [Vicinamibacterales bacterium]
MQEPRTTLSAGQLVIVRDERWAVIGADRFDDVTIVGLRGAAHDNRDEIQSVITPADVIQRSPAPSGVGQRSRRATLAAAASALADATTWDQCWTAAHARIDLHAWQMEPACAAVSGAMRILLADEVGLGKTVQAALIVSELRARGLAERVLVVTPASIREQWACELRDRFALDPVVFDQSTLAITAATLPPDVNPWKTAPLIISSIDLVKRPEVRVALESVPFDVLVVDEAHHLSPGTDRAAVVAELADRTPWVVLATATPHGGDDGAFQFLQRLGDLGTEELRTFCRARRSGAGVSTRRARLLFVRPTGAERALLDATRAYARALTAQTSPGGQLVASVVSRRAASSAKAVHGTVTRRLALLAEQVAPERQALLPWEEEDDADAVSDAVLASPGLRDVAHEVAWLGRLADLARAAGPHSSKVEVIRRLLRRTREQVLVFTEYRDVAKLVVSALADLCAVAPLHGGLSARERRDIVQAFNSGRIRVVVATDAAGEGLNLQARCRLVVNMELPWTPRRLEQRIGRVDRLGQRRRVHAIHLAHDGSYEGTVIARLERRRARASSANRSIEVLDADTAPSASRHLRSLAGPPHAARHTVAAYASRSRSRGAHVVLVYLATLVDGAGRLVQRSVVARRIECVPLPGHRLSRKLVRRLRSDETVRRAVVQQIPELAAAARDTIAPAAAAMERRLTALVAHLERLGAAAVWQASLFDRRAEQRAHVRRSSVAGLELHLRQRLSAVRSLGHASASEPQLVAAWLE